MIKNIPKIESITDNPVVIIIEVIEQKTINGIMYAIMPITSMNTLLLSSMNVRKFFALTRPADIPTRTAMMII